MTTPQLPPLPEQVLPCPFCGGRSWIASNRDTHKLFAEHSESCLWADDEDPIVTTPATDYALAALIESWNTRAALSTRPVAESIHEANAKTLQALVDELREMLGLDHGESLKEAVQRKVEQRDGLESMLKHSRRRNVQQLAESATLFSSLRRIAALSPTRFETHADMAAECQLIALTALEAYVAPIKKEQEA